MTYRVELTTRAQTDLERIYRWIHENASSRGAAWLDSLEHAILSLAEFPERCAVEPSLSSSERAVRKLLFGRRRNVYRIYYAVSGDAVRVLHIRHASRNEPRRA